MPLYEKFQCMHGYFHAWAFACMDDNTSIIRMQAIGFRRVAPLCIPYRGSNVDTLAASTGGRLSCRFSCWSPCTSAMPCLMSSVHAPRSKFFAFRGKFDCYATLYKSLSGRSIEGLLPFAVNIASRNSGDTLYGECTR